VSRKSLGYNAPRSFLQISYCFRLWKTMSISFFCGEEKLFGALTPKNYAFRGRRWDYHSVLGVDYYSPFCTPVRFEVDGAQVVRVVSAGSWPIDDRIRFSHDGYDRNRCLGGDHFIAQLPFWSIAGVLIGPVVGLLDSFCATRLVSCAPISQSNLDYFRLVVNRSWTSLDQLYSSTVVFLLGVNLSHFPLLANWLRHSNFMVVALGCMGIEFPHKNLGSSIGTLISLVEGRHSICQHLVFARPLVLVGDGVFSHSDHFGIVSLVRKLVTLCGGVAQYLVSTVGRNSLFEVGRLPVNFRKIPPVKGGLVLNFGFFSRSYNSLNFSPYRDPEGSTTFPVLAPHEAPFDALTFFGDYVAVPPVIPRRDLISFPEIFSALGFSHDFYLKCRSLVGDSVGFEFSESSVSVLLFRSGGCIVPSTQSIFLLTPGNSPLMALAAKVFGSSVE
jgi:hypothetical protein